MRTGAIQPVCAHWTILVVTLFAIYGWRGLRAAFSAPDSFGRLLAIGITALVLTQALINFAVVLGMVPTKGIPLPFVSYGGSSLLINLVGMGILLNVSQHASGSHTVVTTALPTTADA